jgi:hypothetical protein
MALSACSPAAAGEGAATQSRSLPRFTSIALNGVSKVRIHRGPQAISLTIDSNLIDRYETRVENGKLVMGFGCGLGTFWALRRGLTTCEVDVTMPELDGIELNGAGTIAVDEFAYGKLKAEVNGAGKLELKGSASELKLYCTGSCAVQARELVSESGSIGITGSGHVEARVKDSLDVSISGAGELLYWGAPKLSRKITGAGGVRRAGD